MLLVRVWKGVEEWAFGWNTKRKRKTRILLIIHNILTDCTVELHTCNVRCSIMFEPPEYMEDFNLYIEFVVRGNGTTVHDGSHLAERHKTAAASREETPVPAAGSVSSA
jgi:hypothetical protein